MRGWLTAALLVAFAGAAPAQQGPPPGALPRLGGPPPSLFEAILGLLVEKRMALPPEHPPRTTRVRLTMDETGAVIAHSIERTSGDEAFDAQVVTTLRLFQVNGHERLPVPKDPKLREAALGEGLIVPVRSRPVKAASAAKPAAAKPAVAKTAPAPREAPAPPPQSPAVPPKETPQ